MAEVGPVRAGPVLPAAAARHAHTAFPMAPPGLRVVTYNILADQYASREYAQQHLFAYCPGQCAPNALSSLTSACSTFS